MASYLCRLGRSAFRRRWLVTAFGGVSGGRYPPATARLADSKRVFMTCGLEGAQRLAFPTPATSRGRELA